MKTKQEASLSQTSGNITSHSHQDGVVLVPQQTYRPMEQNREPRNKPRYLPSINKSTNTKCWTGCGEKGTFLHYWWECKLVEPLWRILWRYLRKLYIKLPYDPAISLLGIYPDKTFLKKRHMHPRVHWSTIHNSQDMETT